MSHRLSLARIREALKQNDREKLRQEFQETTPWIPHISPLPSKHAEEPPLGEGGATRSEAGG